jgi:chromosome segregation protein
VNLRAADEAAALAAEVGTAVHERDEVAAAAASLRGSLRRLDEEARSRLMSVFDEVDRQFQDLFRQVFLGGQARLGLVGSDDPLQAGLDVQAQPPGKRLASLTLLSGGEQSLTALCLVLAVFRCNPAPICVLDEVDAALDDANVDRLCLLLSDLARDGARQEGEAGGTRFLVVTHHGLTMARMDRLYGVTMQEPGVSRLLSVDLGEAVTWSGDRAA